MGDNILLKRAKRLRKLTGNPHLHSQSELDQAAMSKKEIAYESLVRPILLTTEPAVLFSNIYIGLVCESPGSLVFLEACLSDEVSFGHRLGVLPLGMFSPVPL